jgi:hypothetical protein
MGCIDIPKEIDMAKEGHICLNGWNDKTEKWISISSSPPEGTYECSFSYLQTMIRLSSRFTQKNRMDTLLCVSEFQTKFHHHHIITTTTIF